LKEILNKYAVYLIGIVFAIAMLYLNSQYVSISTHNELEKRVTVIEHSRGVEKAQNDLKIQSHETEQKILSERLDKKVRLLNKLMEEIDVLENEIIRLQSR
jgi:hypothetical protein